MPAEVNWWVSETPDDAVRRAVSRMAEFEDVTRIAVMPDVHLGQDVCIGTAMATRQLIYPAAVGGDIGCGMLALAFDCNADEIRSGAVAGELLREISRSIPSNRRHRAYLVDWPDDLSFDQLSDPAIARFARTEGTLQLGTLGGGNHFVELQSDSDDRLWLMIHSGSRAIGQMVRNTHIARAKIINHMAALDSTIDSGRAYLNDAEWACRYARANRSAMMSCVINAIHRTINANPLFETLIHIDHNHVRLERHFSEQCWVHRKGAMPADAGFDGVVPGSMGTLSYHIRGLGNEKSLRSSAHGAGRRFSRAAAREKFDRADLKHQMRNVWYDPRRASELLDECPNAYKDVRAVVKAQGELVEVVRTLKPVLVHKQ